MARIKKYYYLYRRGEIVWQHHVWKFTDEEFLGYFNQIEKGIALISFRTGRAFTKKEIEDGYRIKSGMTHRKR